MTGFATCWERQGTQLSLAKVLFALLVVVCRGSRWLRVLLGFTMRLPETTTVRPLPGRPRLIKRQDLPSDHDGL